MNKLFFVLLAVAAVASAQDLGFEDDFSEIAFATNDQAETKYLVGDMQMFSDFCISSRDYVFKQISTVTNEGASKVFALIFNIAESLGSEMVETIGTGNAKLSAQIANPDAEIENLSGAANEIIVQGQADVKSVRIQPFAFAKAFKAMVYATSTAVGNAFQKKLTELQQQAREIASVSTLQAVCEAIKKTNKEVEAKFEHDKVEVVSEKPSLANVLYPQVQCLTSIRVQRIAYICELTQSVAPAVAKMWQTKQQA